MAAGPVQRACKVCNYLSEEDKCPVCGSDTSKEWEGDLVILDHTKSEIAQKMQITRNGRYALRVR